MKDIIFWDDTPITEEQVIESKRIFDGINVDAYGMLALAEFDGDDIIINISKENEEDDMGRCLAQLFIKNGMLHGFEVIYEGTRTASIICERHTIEAYEPTEVHILRVKGLKWLVKE